MRAITRQVSIKPVLFGLALMWAIAQASAVFAHALWIIRGGHRNPAGECGSVPRNGTESVVECLASDAVPRIERARAKRRVASDLPLLMKRSSIRIDR